jgi:hypothetical protein
MRARLQLLRLFQIAHSGEKQKTQQAIREIFRDGTVAFASGKPQTHCGTDAAADNERPPESRDLRDARLRLACS